jgi:hypothetical protein
MLLSAGGFAYYRSETHVFNSLWPRFRDLDQPSTREALLDVWLKAPQHIRSGLDESEARRALGAGFTNGGEFLRLVMDATAAKQGAPRWAETTPAHILHLPEIHATIPDALFIHVIRDGRDVALSLQKQGWAVPLPWDRSQPVLAAGAFWRWTVDAGRRGARRIDRRAYLEVTYEDVTGAPQRTLDRIGEFIEQRLDYSVILQNAVGSVAEPNTSFPGSSGYSRRWERELTPHLARRLEAIVGPMLDKLGYPRAFPDTLTARWRARAHVAPYFARYSVRQWLKSHTALGRRYADLSLFAPPAPDAVHPMPPVKGM